MLKKSGYHTQTQSRMRMGRDATEHHSGPQIGFAGEVGVRLGSQSKLPKFLSPVFATLSHGKASNFLRQPKSEQHQWLAATHRLPKSEQKHWLAATHRGAHPSPPLVTRIPLVT